MTNPRQGFLNPKGVNCLATFPASAPSCSAPTPGHAQNPSFQPVALRSRRHMALFLEQTLLANLAGSSSEPNDEPLGNAIRNTIEAFMLGLFRQGAFQGAKPSEAFQVKCDHQNDYARASTTAS